MPPYAPRLTVVVPCYRAETYLAECLDSVLVFEDADLEVVAVNDGSPDRTPAVLDAYAARDPRVRVLHLVNNGGPGPARNAGLERATGEYVWFVDADDLLPPGALRTVLNRLAESRPDVLIVNHAVVLPDLSVLRTGAKPTAVHPRLLRLAQSACTKIVKCSVIEELDLRFPPGWYEDVPFSHALLMAAKRIDLLDDVCYHYRRHNRGSITSSVSRRHFEVFDQYARLFARAPREFRSELFRAMVDHYLVILGSGSRLPRRARRQFFHRVVKDYLRWLPAEGYPIPAGVGGVKHRLVGHGAYPAYAALRLIYRAVPQRYRFGRQHLSGAPPQAFRSPSRTPRNR